MISSFHFTEGSFGYKASDDQLSDYAVTLSDYGLAECPIGRLCFIYSIFFMVYLLWKNSCTEYKKVFSIVQLVR